MASRIVHFADLHLDTSFAASCMTSSVASRRREDLRAALRRIVDFAISTQADAVTIGGDLYEQDRCTIDTANFLRHEFERAHPIRVLISPGNHDPWLPHSLYRQVAWPPNVFVFAETTPYPYRMGDVTIWGAAHDSPACRDNLIASTRVPTDGIHLLLLHASDTASIPTAKGVYCPLATEDVSRAGFALALLGHYHGARLTPANRPLICYPGSPEPLGFDEEGPHYVVVVKADEQGLEPRLVKINQTNYVNLNIDISGADTRQDIKDAVTKRAEEHNLANAFVRLRMIGMLHPQVDLDPDSLLSDLSEHFAFLDLHNDTYPAYDLEALKDDHTVRGAFVRRMVALRDKVGPSETRKVEQALYLGLQALDGRELRPR